VKRLFDANVSQKLVGILAHEFPGSVHVRAVGLRAAQDGQIWDHARMQGLMIVSKDTDFRERSYVEGFPPKIIWLDVGNAGTCRPSWLCQQSQHDEGRRTTFVFGSRLRQPYESR
jgi:predicted nuclease of predicted toxin-antitoxin system